MPKKKLPPQEWASRREVPNPQVRDAADQYEMARRILDFQSSLGVEKLLLPRINVAAMAVELYLKSLSAETVHVAQESLPPISKEALLRAGIEKAAIEALELDKKPLRPYRVHAAADGGHRLHEILENIEDDVRTGLEDHYKELTGAELHSDLEELSIALEYSRYPYEESIDLERINVSLLMWLSEYLHGLVGTLEPIETVRWRDYRE